MADTINKQKLQLRAVVSPNGDKNPSPATKLLISHGKPNFTIQRSTSKVSQNGGGAATGPLSPQENNNNNINNNTNNNISNNNANNNKDDNYNPYRSANVNGTSNGKVLANGNGDLIIKSTKINGVFKPANVAVIAQQNNDSTENEAANVVLRRTARASEPAAAEEEDDTVPEFIRRQRRIQERLAKDNVLDFENRRSGYFTHVMISPTSASRTSFAETMASPAVVPSLEMAPPPSPKKEEQVEVQTNGHTAEETKQAHEQTHEQVQEQAHAQVHEETHKQTHEQTYEQTQLEEEAEVAKAIEEVNKAVAGEEDTADELLVTAVTVTTSSEQDAVVIQHKETVTISHTNGGADNQTQQHSSGALCTHATNAQPYNDTVQLVTVEHITPVLHNGTEASSIETEIHASGALCINSPKVKDDASITRQHSSGALVVHHETSAPLSFEDTVKYVPAADLAVHVEPVHVIAAASIESVQHSSGALMTNHEAKLTETKVDDDAELQAMAHLKFDIKVEDAQNIEVTPVLRTD